MSSCPTWLPSVAICTPTLNSPTRRYGPPVLWHNVCPAWDCRYRPVPQKPESLACCVGASSPRAKTLAIRADMDALPIHELNEIDYRSTVEGKMHACGHDGHTAIALAVAALLSKRQAELTGNVKFLFQPAEEGRGGAK